MTQIQNSLLLLNPRLRRKVIKTLEEFNEKKTLNSFNLIAFETLRTLERQKMLYGKGRGKLELIAMGVPIKYSMPNEKKVTWTLKSNHLTGNAIDFSFYDKENEKVSWSGDWDEVMEIAKKNGLINNPSKELCHFEEIKKG